MQNLDLHLHMRPLNLNQAKLRPDFPIGSHQYTRRSRFYTALLQSGMFRWWHPHGCGFSPLTHASTHASLAKGWEQHIRPHLISTLWWGICGNLSNNWPPRMIRSRSQKKDKNSFVAPWQLPQFQPNPTKVSHDCCSLADSPPPLCITER